LIQTNRGVGYTFTCVTPFPTPQVHHANGFPVASVGTGDVERRRVVKGRGFTHGERLGEF
jgi:hypothetical protein